MTEAERPACDHPAALLKSLEGKVSDRKVLSPCRGPEPHVRGCWVVDLVLGKE
jgi:hypothetical protein